MKKATAIITTTQANEITPAPVLLDLLIPFAQALDLRVRAGELSTNAATTYLRGSKRFITWLEQQESRAVEADTIRAWKADLAKTEYEPGKTYSPATINLWLAGVKALFGWATERGKLSYNPAALIKGASRKGTKKHHKREVLTPSEMRRVLSIPDTTKQGLRDKAILALMAYTGVRSIEVHRADYKDLHTQGGRLVLFVQGKGHIEADDFVVIANPNLESALSAWLAVRGKQGGALFCSLSNRSQDERLSLRALRFIVKDYFAKAGVVGNKSTHSLRHTAITTAIQAGAPLQKVMSMSRHANIDTLMIYAHEIDRLEQPAEELITY